MTPLLRTLGTASLVEHPGPAATMLDIQPKRLALLVFLARASRTASVRRDVLLAHFWPESDEQHARASLRQSLSAFRKQLGPDAILTSGEEEVAVAPGALRCDANEFEAEYQRGNHEAACRLFAGEFLQGFHATDVAPEFEQWMDAERQRLRHMAGDAAARASKQAELMGEPVEAVRWARRAAEIEPDNEAAAARLIALLDARGDRAGALGVYRDLVRRLEQEYAALPSPETRALIKGLRARPTPTQTAGPDALSVPKSSNVAEVSPAATNPRKRTLRAAIAGVAFAVVVAVVVGSSASPPAPFTDRDLIAVAPFRLHAADSSLGWLPEGIAELLTDRLSAVAGPEVANSEAFLAAWHRLLENDGAAGAEMLKQVGSASGAGRIVQGGVTGTARELVLTAWVTSASGARVTERATSRGPVDSLPGLIDDLSRQLLGRLAGVESHQLGSLTGVAPQALRAFLAGRAELRRGRAEHAVRYLRDALAADSTFALASLELGRIAALPGAEVSRQPAIRVALAHRDRLSAADRALLPVLAGNWSGAPDMYATLNAGVAAFPLRAEMWYYLGDAWLHFGHLAGATDALSRAEYAFRRGWVLDSAANGAVPIGSPLLAEPALHLVELAHIRADTTEVRRLVALIVRADSASDLAGAARWHRAVLGGAAALNEWWNHAGPVSLHTAKNIGLFIHATGIGAQDMLRVNEATRRLLLAFDPGFRAHALFLIASNAGRPSDLPAKRDDEAPFAERSQREVRAWMWWGLDSAVGSRAARELATLADARPVGDTAVRVQDRVVCTMGNLRAHQGDTALAARAARRLRVSRLTGLAGRDSASYDNSRALCVALIDARIAASSGQPDALDKTSLADSLARTNIHEVCCYREAVSDANLILARLWEELDEPGSALAALRRRSARYLRGALFESTYLREEGRLALSTGDTAGAIRSWRHYLALRPDPEPMAEAEVDSVRRALATLATR